MQFKIFNKSISVDVSVIMIRTKTCFWTCSDPAVFLPPPSKSPASTEALHSHFSPSWPFRLLNTGIIFKHQSQKDTKINMSWNSRLNS